MDAASCTASPPPLSHHSGRRCRCFLRRADRVVVLRGRALVRVARLRERILENAEPAVGSLLRLYRGYIFDSLRIICGSEAGASPRFAQRSHYHYRRTTVEAAG